MQDPLAEYYFKWSPYNYALDNPIRYIDPYGLSIKDWWNRMRNLFSRDDSDPFNKDRPIMLPGVDKSPEKKENSQPSGIHLVSEIIGFGPGIASEDPDVQTMSWDDFSFFLRVPGRLNFGTRLSRINEFLSRLNSLQQLKKLETSDEEIIKENTGNPEVSGPEKTSKNDDSIYVKITIQKYMFPWSKTSIQGYPDSIKAHRKDSAKTVDYYENTIFE